MNRIVRRTMMSAAVAAAFPLSTALADGFGFNVLYTFQGGSDGSYPTGGLIADSAGNLYGVTGGGGESTNCHGCGTIFELTAGGSEIVLHALDGSSDGSGPEGPLARDRAGNLTGAAMLGGTNNLGTVFRLAPNGAFNVLHTFAEPPDGEEPFSGLSKSRGGRQYGTAVAGGTSSCECGTIYEVAKNGTVTVLYSFTGGSDGAYPLATPIQDSAGNLYGTTDLGGVSGNGAIYRLAPDGTLTTLYSFTNGNDGANPQNSLIADSAGNLYGTAQGGSGGNGTVFRLAPDGTFTLLYAFSASGTDGANPTGNLVRERNGYILGTTTNGGGATSCYQGCGTVFELNARGGEIVLHAFQNGSDGAQPQGGLLEPTRGGTLYGTASIGGSQSQGVIYTIEPFR